MRQGNSNWDGACAIIHWFTGGNAKSDVGLCNFTVSDNV